LAFVFEGKKISDNQIKRLLDKGSTVKLKGFKVNGKNVEGIIKLNKEHQMILEASAASKIKSKALEMPACPRCKKGKLIRGKTAYGCSEWKGGCDFRYPFTQIKTKAGGKKLTRELVLRILSE